MRDLRNRTSHVIDAVKAGERVTLTVHGENPSPISFRTVVVAAGCPESGCATNSPTARPMRLSDELDDLVGQTLDQPCQ